MNGLPKLLAAVSLLAGCVAPDLATGRSTVSARPVLGSEGVNDAFTARVLGAEAQVRVALPLLSDEQLASAIIERHQEGIDVEVVTDIDEQDSEQVAALIDAGVPVALADDGVTYFDFNLNQDVSWASQDVVMTNAFVVADSIDFTAADRAGGTSGGYRVLLEGTHQWIAEDLEAEHNQLMGGTDASSLTAFSSLAKSILDSRWAYHAEDDAVTEVWFGPQERLIKRLIDATYRAQSSVWVLSAALEDEGLARALQAKAANGFDVQVVVSNDQSDGIFGPGVVLARETPDVPKYTTSVDGPVPTIVVVDYAPDRTGALRSSQAFVLTHPIVSAARLFQDQEVATDQLMDGTLWVLREWGGTTEDLDRLVDVVQVHLDASEGW